MKIILTAEDAFAAASVATCQIVRKVAKERASDHGGVSQRGLRTRWGDGIHGMLGEIALSRLLNRAWTPGGVDVSTGDVGFKLEVRATEYENGHLLIYSKDNDDSRFALMVGSYPEFQFAGYIRAVDARQPDFWNKNADPPCWFVPQKALNQSIEELTA